MCLNVICIAIIFRRSFLLIMVSSKLNDKILFNLFFAIFVREKL